MCGPGSNLYHPNSVIVMARRPKADASAARLERVPFNGSMMNDTWDAQPCELDVLLKPWHSRSLAESST